MSDIMLRIENVSKQYVLGQIGGTTLRDELQRLSARLHRREDPTKRIGSRDYTPGETFMALDGVSFDVMKGERVGIIGHNGAGKSTLLKLISRVTAPTGGRIGLNGRVASMLEVGTGFHGELTGRENIYMNGAILGMKKREIDEKIEDIIEFSECRQFIDTPVKRYSSGMYVKLAFSVAAHLDSEIMIMDEVLAVGDMAFQKKCLDKMNDVSRAEGRTILYVSHNMNTIRQLCDRCIVLNHGKVVFDGGVEEGISAYMGRSSSEFPVFYDYRKSKRRFHFGGEIYIESFRLLGCENAVFKCGERLLMEFTIGSHISRDNVCIILRIKDRQNVQKIASCFSERFDVKGSKETIQRFMLVTSGLVEGVYTLSFEIIQFNHEDNYYTYDNPDAAIPINLIDDGRNRGWSVQYWGNIRWPDMPRINRIMPGQPLHYNDIEESKE